MSKATDANYPDADYPDHVTLLQDYGFGLAGEVVRGRIYTSSRSALLVHPNMAPLIGCRTIPECRFINNRSGASVVWRASHPLEVLASCAR